MDRGGTGQRDRCECVTFQACICVHLLVCVSVCVWVVHTRAWVCVGGRGGIPPNTQPWFPTFLPLKGARAPGRKARF